MILLTYVLGFVALYLAARKTRHSDKVISAVLGVLWIWTGVVFCIAFYGPMSACSSQAWSAFRWFSFTT
jgi:hypothetical protein